MKWRDIDTAPKDGSHVILYYGLERIGGFEIGAWRDGAGPEPWTTPGWYCCARSVSSGGLQPTHWLPLPTPPDLDDVQNAVRVAREATERHE